MTAHRLVLIRHAKTGEGRIDVERPLTPRGRRDAAAAGAALAGADIRPDLAVVSPALRARQTWTDAAAALNWSGDVVIDDRIYDNDPDELLAVAHDTPAGTATLVLVGHNPSFEQFAHALDDGTGDAAARERLGHGYPTAGVAVFDINGEWTDLDRGTAVLRSFAVPG